MTTRPELSRRDLLRIGGVAAAGLGLAACGGSSTGTDLSTKASKKLAPFDASMPAGPPTGLPKRVAWANTSDVEIFVRLGNGIQQAASDRGLGYITANCEGDPSTNVSQIQTFLARGVGSVVIQPLDTAAQAPVLQSAIKNGVLVQGLITWPSILQVAAKQYDIGFAQGKAAAEFATKQLGGKTDALILMTPGDSEQLLLRIKGYRAGLATGGPGINVLPLPTVTPASIEGGYSAMSSAIEANPNIGIVMGDDSYVVGAYRALQSLGKLSPNIYLSGVDGDLSALALVKPGSSYHASFAFPWGLLGYATGQFAADWVEGKPVPRVVIAAAPMLDTEAKVKQFLSDNGNPAAVFADPDRLQKYLPLFGTVTYQSHSAWESAYVPA